MKISTAKLKQLIREELFYREFYQQALNETVHEFNADEIVKKTEEKMLQAGLTVGSPDPRFTDPIRSELNPVDRKTVESYVYDIIVSLNEYSIDDYGVDSTEFSDVVQKVLDRRHRSKENKY